MKSPTGILVTVDLSKKDKQYPLYWWRPMVDIFSSYLVWILAAILTIKISVLYPIALLVIANRMLALSLLCHEGLHSNLYRNRNRNDFIGRWLCAYPTCISFLRYRKLHLLHHRTVGQKGADPDYHLYRDYPQSGKMFLLDLVKKVLTLRLQWDFLLYYTDIPDFIKSLTSKKKFNFRNTDFIGFICFHLVLLGIVIYFQLYIYFILFYALPLILVTQPYVILMGGLQHGPLQNEQNPELLSRTIYGPKWLMEILLPLNINYHAEHHLDSTVPHYHLKKLSLDLEDKKYIFWTESYKESLEKLFYVPKQNHS